MKRKVRTYKSITAEYGVSKASISKWCSEFSKECQTKALGSPDIRMIMTTYEGECSDSKEKTKKLRKENLFLKKAAAFFAKEID